MTTTAEQKHAWSRRRQISRTLEGAVRFALGLTTLTIIAPVVLIVIFLLWNSREAFFSWTGQMPHINWEFLTQGPRRGLREGGIAPAILGTLALVTLTVAMAVPAGVLAAIYLTEYARRNALTRAIRLAIVNLAGVPSVVYGVFGVGLFVYTLKFGFSLLSGACTLAVLALPMIITASEEALLTVPASFREASLALGASKWQTIWRIVLPNALPGILTGIILSVGRAAGETAPLLLTCMAFSVVGGNGLSLPKLSEPILTLPTLLYNKYADGAPAASQWGTAVVLAVLVLSMNTTAIVLRTRLRRGRKW
jgi:phosphate transport system permease protein